MAGIGAKLTDKLLSKADSALIASGEKLAGSAESRLEATAVKALESQVAKAETALGDIAVDLPMSTYHAPAKPPGKAPSGMKYVLNNGRWVLSAVNDFSKTGVGKWGGRIVAGGVAANQVNQCWLNGALTNKNGEGWANTIQRAECATVGTNFTCNCGPHTDDDGSTSDPKKKTEEIVKKIKDKAEEFLDSTKERSQQVKEDANNAIKNTKEKAKEKLSDIAEDNPFANLHNPLNDMNLPTPQVNIPGAAEGTMVVVAVAVVLGLSFVLIRG